MSIENGAKTDEVAAEITEVDDQLRVLDEMQGLINQEITGLEERLESCLCEESPECDSKQEDSFRSPLGRTAHSMVLKAKAQRGRLSRLRERVCL